MHNFSTGRSQSRFIRTIALVQFQQWKTSYFRYSSNLKSVVAHPYRGLDPLTV